MEAFEERIVVASHGGRLSATRSALASDSPPRHAFRVASPPPSSRLVRARHAAGAPLHGKRFANGLLPGHGAARLPCRGEGGVIQGRARCREAVLDGGPLGGPRDMAARL